MRTILLLTTSNIFMTVAWYGHLKYRNSTLWKVILVNWGIAFFEYCFQVPANRIGSYEFSTAQLENDSGSHHADGLFRILRAVPGRQAQVELRRGLRLHCGGIFFYFSQVVDGRTRRHGVFLGGHTTTSCPRA